MRRAVTAVAVLTASAAVTLTPVASSAAAPYKGANTAAVQDDFNGDGYRDLAVGAPSATNGTVQAAGSVVVLYGSASSVSTARKTVITQSTTGVPGTAEEFDHFGATVASADLDRDGYADLIIGAPDEDVDGAESRGSVTVVWGGPNGLKGGANISPPAGYDEYTSSCGFGLSLAAGDMNGDGAPELGVASDLCAVASYSGPFSRTGQAAERYLEWRQNVRGVVMGDVNGDDRAERFYLAGPSDDDVRGPVTLDTGAPDPEDTSVNRGIDLPYADGYAGQVGDVNGDGYGDLVTGIPADDSVANGFTPAAHRGGEIQVLHGGPQGITPAQKPKVFHQDTPGVPGTAEWGDRFGRSLSVGDTDGDRYADVLVGSPEEAVGSLASAGTAVLLRGSASGLTTAKAVAYTQNTAGVPGAAETGDWFGTAVHLADLTKDGKAETVVGAPTENSDGCAWVARGSASGPVLNGSVNLCGKSVGITVGEVKGYFGAALTSPHWES
ncbi:hypothetical protein [Streptomyces sp. NPDC029554]|uniref:hypothetical protein n=1 Tax=Streptomyces sp. NPDC029554 TaxID=3155126 RepID=UPI0033F2E10D